MTASKPKWEKIQKIFCANMTTMEIEEYFEDCHLTESDYSGKPPDKIVHGYFVPEAQAKHLWAVIDGLGEQDLSIDGVLAVFAERDRLVCALATAKEALERSKSFVAATINDAPTENAGELLNDLKLCLITMKELEEPK